MPLSPLRPALVVLLALSAPAAQAVGSDDPAPPTPTQTTEVCEDGLIWDAETELCVAPTQESGLTDDQLYDAAREFAYAGQYEHAQAALRAMSDPGQDRVLAYMGFTTRAMGDMAGGMAYYQAALTANPDNLLARSYMGQALVLQGDIEGAMTQLLEIEARGGARSWPHLALLEAIEKGTPSFY